MAEVRWHVGGGCQQTLVEYSGRACLLFIVSLTCQAAADEVIADPGSVTCGPSDGGFTSRTLLSELKLLPEFIGVCFGGYVQALPRLNAGKQSR